MSFPVLRNVLATLVAAGSVVLQAQPFADPAPPAVNEIAASKPAEAQDFTGRVFHALPKPLPAGAVVQDWPCFLGPNHNATSNETKLLSNWDEKGPPLVWEVKRGTGYASPAVAQGKVVMFHRVGDEEVVECLEAETGKRFWRHAYLSAYQDRYGYCDGPRCQPVIDGEFVYTFGAEGILHCLSMATGQVRWKRDILGEFKIKQNFFGVGATPLVEGEWLIINIGAPGGPCVAAFDKNNGKLAWGAGNQWGPSYASPIPAVVQGKRRVFVFAGGESRPATGGLLCIDPADGHVDFTFPWRGKRYESVNASSPMIVGNQVYVSECYGRGGAMIDVAPDLSAKAAWTNEKLGTHFMTAIAKDGYLYGVDGHGPLDAPIVCLKLDSGEEVWRHEAEWEENITVGNDRGKRKIGLARCSLLLAEGRFLCLGEYGHLLWVDLTPNGYKEDCRAWLFAAGETWTLPVLSHGLLYVCQNTRDGLHGVEARVLCYDLRKGDKVTK